MNNIEKVCKMLGVSMGEEINIKDYAHNPYTFRERGLVDAEGDDAPYALMGLITGRDVIEPFKPANRATYYIVSTNGDIASSYWTGCYFDVALYSMGNCFKTQEQAGKNKHIILAKMEQMGV